MEIEFIGNRVYKQYHKFFISLPVVDPPIPIEKEESKMVVLMWPICFPFMSNIADSQAYKILFVSCL